MLSRTASSLIRRQSARSFASIASGSSFLSRAVKMTPDSARATTQFQLQFQHVRHFSTPDKGEDDGDDSHDDFAPEKKEVSDDGDETMEMIRQHVSSNPVMVYMKGNPSMPMCGFSAKMVQTLQAEGIDFSSVNVLDYPTIREGVKKYAAWPTM